MITVQAHHTYRLAAVVSAIVSRMGVFSFLISNLLLFAACSGSSDGSDEPQKPDYGPSVLNIYVYAPGQAVPTRANEGEVDAETAESAINTLQIWVFTHEDTPKLVTYFKTNSFLHTADEDYYKFELPIDDDYAKTAVGDRPTVDVYVLANVTSNNCGLDFDETTTKATLEGAVLEYDATAGTDYFGLTAPVTEVPFEGLPMSGVLREQTVSGSKPVLTLGTSPENMAKVKLARAVSKVRFVFSCSTDFDGLKINSVTLGNNMIPNEEYLFLTDVMNPYGYKDNDFNIKGTDYNIVDDEHPAPSLFSIDATARCEDPAHYAWDRLVNDEKTKNPSITDQELAEAYEELINEGLSSNVAPTYAADNETVIDPGHVDPRLTERRVYLRESDKRLSGTITYQVKKKGDADYGADNAEGYYEAPFSMVAPADPNPWQPFFSRNHTWTVYVYLSWAKIEIVAVKVVNWESEKDPYEHELYNW